MGLYQKFGEFGSAKEINDLAVNLLKEGDKKSIKALAEENGIPKEFAEMFIQGDIEDLCDAYTAAYGKIDAECKDLKPVGIMVDWAEYIKTCCLEEETMAEAVREKGRSIKGCIGKLLEWSFKNQKEVDKEIIKAAGVNASKVTFGMPGQAEARKIIRDYYLGGRK